MRFLKFALAGACALALFAAASARAEPVKIRMSWVAPLANWGSIILEKKDLLTHMGKSYTLESIHFQGTPQTITAIANNELEVASLAYSSLAIAIENAGLDDLRVIADEFQDGVPGYFSEEYYVRKDSGHQQGRGPQGQGNRHQRRRQRRRRRDARHAAQARPRGQARLHHAGRPAAGDAGHAVGEEGRPHSGRAALRAQSRSCAPKARCCSTSATRSA